MKSNTPSGEMSEKALISVASKISSGGNWTAQKRFYYDPKNKRKFYKVDCVSLDLKTVIEYEGPNHYCDVWKHRRDESRKLFFEEKGFSFYRWPYFCQLTRSVADFFFGPHDFETYISCISDVYGVRSEKSILACGFHTTLNTPSNFTFLGIERFLEELAELPVVVKTQVAESLRLYCRDVEDTDLVIGRDPRLLELLNFEGSGEDLKAFYSRLG
tara:strand:- start:559 stop:1203 length:645 start_codon:yes stop_codon:yes gene_type:complete